MSNRSSCCYVEKDHSRHCHKIFVFTMLAASKSIICCCDYKIGLTQYSCNTAVNSPPVSWLFIVNLLWCLSTLVFFLPATQDLQKSPVPEQILEKNSPHEVQPLPQAPSCSITSLLLTRSYWLLAAVPLQIHLLRPEG